MVVQLSKNFEYKIENNSKTKIRKNLKLDFSFVSAHCASFIKTGPFLREKGGGGLRIVNWK